MTMLIMPTFVCYRTKTISKTKYIRQKKLTLIFGDETCPAETQKLTLTSLNSKITISLNNFLAREQINLFFQKIKLSPTWFVDFIRCSISLPSVGKCSVTGFLTSWSIQIRLQCWTCQEHDYRIIWSVRRSVHFADDSDRHDWGQCPPFLSVIDTIHHSERELLTCMAEPGLQG